MGLHNKHVIQYTCYTPVKFYKKFYIKNCAHQVLENIIKTHFQDHYQTLENEIVFQKHSLEND